jgi:flagellin-specific chaperone FliS
VSGPFVSSALKTSNTVKGRLSVLLYEGALKFMKLAIQESEAGHYAEKGRYILAALLPTGYLRLFLSGLNRNSQSEQISIGPVKFYG